MDMAKKEKYKSLAIVIILVVVIGAVLIAANQQEKQGWVACTADAKLCSDGGYVGRIAPDCRFAPCSGCACPSGYVQDGDACNPQCYYSNPRCLMPSIQCENST